MKLFLLTVILLIGIQTATETETENLYDLLEITESATSQQIKKAFRRLSIKMHPDRNAGDPEAQVNYLAIQRAYQVLIDVSKRNTYDLYGQEGLAEIQKRPKPKGGDYRPEMPVPLSKFYEGGQMTFSFRRGQICRNCKGSGDQQGVIHVCEACKGTGKMYRKVKVKDSYKQMGMKCKQCQGSGKAPKHRCPVCGGQKIQLKPRDLVFDVDKGMVDGDKVLFKGQSQQGLQFYPGDVIVTLKQQPHPQLKRIRNDLKTTIKISLAEAILGFQRHIKQLDGRQIDIIGDYNIQDGEIIRIHEEGMPIRGEHGSYGNLLAQININFPRSYNHNQLQQIRKIFEEQSDSEQL